MKGSNSLTSHWGESASHDIRKMSGSGRKFILQLQGHSKTYIKTFTTRKNRMTAKRLLREDITEHHTHIYESNHTEA